MDDFIKQNENERLEFQKSFVERQQKFIYYIIALCVTAIGFSIHSTSGKELSYSQIPLGLAILLWSISIYWGFLSLKAIINYLKNMNEGFERMLGSYKGMEFGDSSYSSLSETREYKFAQKEKAKSAFNFKVQEVSFLLGVLAFIIWHVLEMYLRSV